jgi:hypothetical protein
MRRASRNDQIMTTRRKMIERRLFEAVMLVLSGAGCYVSAPPPAGPQQPEPLPPPRHDHARTDDPWAKPPPDDSRPHDPQLHNPQQHTPPPHRTAVSPALAKAEQVCAAYKRTNLDPTTTPPVPSPTQAQHPISETSNWDAGQNAALCTIMRDTQTGDISITHTPRCCPMPGPVQRQCPGPQTYTQKGKVLLVERASVAEDGTVLASNLTWTAFEPYRKPEPYCGRLPEGAVACGAREPGSQALPHHLAAMAELEAASIPAFDRLARELAAYGAPAKLVRRAYAAMRDEIRHERVMRALAIQHGVAPRAIAVTELPCRSLEAIARENAIEGCVREAYGALVATYQAERALPQLRPIFRAIARDERRHASLAEDAHAWIVEQLGDSERGAVEEARAIARTELRASLAAMPVCAELGTPEPAHATALFDTYFGQPS